MQNPSLQYGEAQDVSALEEGQGGGSGSPTEGRSVATHNAIVEEAWRGEPTLAMSCSLEKQAGRKRPLDSHVESKADLEDKINDANSSSKANEEEGETIEKYRSGEEDDACNRYQPGADMEERRGLDHNEGGAARQGLDGDEGGVASQSQGKTANATDTLNATGRYQLDMVQAVGARNQA